MPTIERNAPGSFCWIELGTTDIPGAKQFYGGLFGWQTQEIPMPNGAPYVMWMLNDKQVGAMYEQDENMRKQAPPNWMTYVAVESAEQAANRAKELGGNVITGPMDVMEEGSLAVVADPTGAVFSVWQTKRHTGIQIAGELNTLCWSELATPDGEKAKTFYQGMFGWEYKRSELSPVEYFEIYNGGQAVGGILQMTDEWQGIPPHWMPYFAVRNCDQSTARVKELGGQLKHGPMDIPNVGRFSIISDPQGAVLTIIEITGMS